MGDARQTAASVPAVTGPEAELVGLLMVGDLDKPFHLCECECDSCENWRRFKGRPTRSDLRAALRAVTNDR